MAKEINRSKSDKIFDFCNYVMLSIILVIVLYPLWFVVIASFSDPIEVTTGNVWLYPKGFNIDAYLKVFNKPDILIGYRNTIIYTILGTCVNIIMTVLGAYPLSKKNFRGKNLIMGMMMFTMFFSGGLIPTYLVYKSLGFINSPLVMIVPGAISVYNLIIVKTFFQTTIPYELQEAGVMDGCNNIKILTKIILPLSKPILAVMVIFYGVGHWNKFFEAMIYITDRKLSPLQLILREILIINEGMGEMMGDAEALAKKVMIAESIKYAVIIVSSIPVLILYPFLQKYFVKGVMIGAVKG